MALPSMTTAGHAAAAAGVAGGVWGKFATGYSRSLYLYDAEFRFDRMAAGYEFANAQQEMFRSDLVMMTELTFRKMAIYTVLGTMGMAIYIAIFCAGRLGLHGPSPPGWIMSLFLTNIAMAFAMAGIGIWLAFHAMWRCKAACTHLSTRKIRLLIPTRKKLDEARKYGNQWEHQKIRDLARVPYISDMLGHKWSGQVPDVSDDEADYSGSDGSGRRAKSAPPGARGFKRVPCWIAEEYMQDRVGIAGGSSSAGRALDDMPEHFRLYAQAQAEWFTHDCYARICMFYSFLSFFQGCSFYGLGQIAIELRAWWPMFANNFVLMVLHGLLLVFDIVQHPVRNHNSQERLPYMQFCGTLTIPVAAIGMALDFRVEYWQPAIQLTWVCIFVCHILQIVYSLRLLELVIPVEVVRDERMGGMWWPKDWKIPAAFQHVYYFVAPPSRLATEKGQYDTVRELKEGYSWTSPDGKQGGDMGSVESTIGIEDYFRWMQHQNLAAHSLDQVHALYQRFSNARRQMRGNQLKSELIQIEKELYAIETAEVIGSGNKGYFRGDGGSTTASGSGAASGSDGMSSGKNANVYSKDYTSTTPRPHPGLPSFTKVSFTEPYKVVAIICGTFAATWVFLTLCMVVDRIVGVQGLVTAPHWAKPPMSRSSLYPWERGTPLGNNRYMGDRPWRPEELYWHENHKVRPGGWKPHWMDFGHEGRRLAASSSPHAAAAAREGMKAAFTSLVSALPSASAALELLNRVPTKEEADALTNLEARFRTTGTHWKPEKLSWPGFFEPKMVAWAPNREGVFHALALTPRGVGSAAHLGGNGNTERFMLTGLSDYPALLSASWARGGKEGLMLVSKMGDMLHCPGVRSGTQWACGVLPDAPARLPLAEGAHLTAAAAAWIGAGKLELHVALILESSPDVVALWVLDGNTEAASWLPLGEMPVPKGMAAGASVSFVNDGELLIATTDGATIQRRISDGSVVTSTPALNLGGANQKTLQWQAACSTPGPDNRIVHLSMRHEANKRQPEMMVLRWINKEL